MSPDAWTCALRNQVALPSTPPLPSSLVPRARPHFASRKMLRDALAQHCQFSVLQESRKVKYVQSTRCSLILLCFALVRAVMNEYVWIELKCQNVSILIVTLTFVCKLKLNYNTKNKMLVCVITMITSCESLNQLVLVLVLNNITTATIRFIVKKKKKYDII